MRSEGKKFSYMHLRHLNPLPRNFEEVISRFKRLFVPEMNLGQLSTIIQGKILASGHRLPQGSRQSFQGKRNRRTN
jgi:2-oxoglutarate ferredoxin oxidoreductase subunit alpha